MNQATISSYFSPGSKKTAKVARPRSDSPIDLTSDLDDQPPAKKRKALNTQPNGSVLPEKDASAHTQETANLEQYRNDPSPSRERTLDPAFEKARKQRRERLKHILLADHNVLARDTDDGEDAVAEEEESEEEASQEQETANQSTGPTFEELMSVFKASGSKASGSKQGGGKQKATPKVQEIGPSGEAYTALELQVRDFKKRYPGTMLMFEVGYKCYFYGEDAQVAAKLLGVVCFQKRNFLNAMIPVHRKELHLKKLLAQGHKVGIVEQTETAALKKVSKNKSRLFERELTHLYTPATYVDQLNSVDDTDPVAAPPLVCLIEEPKGDSGLDQKVCVSIISITVSTGDVVWDHFEDNQMRTELETRLVHITPAELLLPEEGLSKSTEKMLSYFVAHSHTEHKIRTERFAVTKAYTDAFAQLTTFYTGNTETPTASQSVKSGEFMAIIANFPKQVVIALAHAVTYLSTFGLEDVLLETRFFKNFTERTHMLLNGNTLTNLEIYRNETDYAKKGSLFWILDSTSTRFGARMLKDWIGRPLIDKAALQARTDTIDEMLTTESGKLTTLRSLLRGLPDLARGLSRIQYGKCTPQELAMLLTAFAKIGRAFEPVDSPELAGFQSPILNEVLYLLPKLRQPVQSLLDAINLKAAKEGRKEDLWTDEDKYPDVLSFTMSIQIAESELVDELRKIRKQLLRPALQFSTINGEEYVLELKKSELKQIPPRWILVSGTRHFWRLRSPEIAEKLEARARGKEALAAAANRAFRSFLEEISENHYALLRDAVNKLAVADCLSSLAVRALEDGYVRPQFSEEDALEIIDGRHPMIEALRDSPFVPNSINMRTRHKVITGPNMGGKSSVVRMVALCAIMAQIGSYVPAQSMTLGMLDGILVRMGASDELARGRSTFMVEMQETSDILRLASPRTLVILDELGRGTSTFDGMAIASAVLQQLVETTKCKTLFITHYPEIALELERKFPAAVENVHMGYMEEKRPDRTRQVTFLYKLTHGITTNSFGVECARLAGISERILAKAAIQADTMQSLIEQRSKKNRLRKSLQLVHKLAQSTFPEYLMLDELRIITDSIASTTI